MANDKEPMPSIPTKDNKTSISQSSYARNHSNNSFTLREKRQYRQLPEIFSLEETYITGDGLLREYFGLGSLTDILKIPDPKTLMHTISDGLMKKISFTLLLDSMIPEVSERFIVSDSVKDIWDTVFRLYSKLEDES